MQHHINCTKCASYDKKYNYQDSNCLTFRLIPILDFLFFRSHDICLEVTGEYLAPGQCKNGLCNFSPFTRSPCGCDNNFVRCLKKAKTKIANTLGTKEFLYI